MEHIIRVKRLGFWARLADIMMVPIMYVLSGTPRETPQRTHRWNNTKLKPADITWLSPTGMVRCSGIGTRRGYESVVFHLPIFGGWRNYVVLRPREPKGGWYVGWKVNGKAGISRVRIDGAVRMLVGPDPVEFFGIDARTGTQRFIHDVAKGRIGNGGPYAKLLLL